MRIVAVEAYFSSVNAPHMGIEDEEGTRFTLVYKSQLAEKQVAMINMCLHKRVCIRRATVPITCEV